MVHGDRLAELKVCVSLRKYTFWVHRAPFWTPNWTNCTNLDPKLDKFGESEGHLERSWLSWGLNRDPWGPGDLNWSTLAPKWAPNGAHKGPRRPRLWTSGTQDEPKESKDEPIGGQKWSKRAPKMRLKAIMHVFRVVKIHRGK